MNKHINWKPAILALVGLVAIATIGLNGRAESRGHVAVGDAVSPLDCNLRDPFSPCFDLKLGYPAGDLFITEDFF